MRAGVAEALQHNHRLILASRSPRRQALLKALGFSFEVQVKETDESFPPELKGAAIAKYLCRKKAAPFDIPAGSNDLVITADTIVWINDRVLNKPGNEPEAMEMLETLSGNRHEVFTGVCLKSISGETVFCVRSLVYFRKLNREEILSYIKNYKPFDKAGSYGAQECLPEGMNPCSGEEVLFLKSIGKEDLIAESIQKKIPGKSFHCIEKIEGSYFNVMGLPVKELYETFAQLLYNKNPGSIA